jgi:CRISPR-associated endonuclease/helicase Cas3
MSEIQSHPHLSLAEHLAEIRAAAVGILRRHGRRLLENCPELPVWFDDAVALHDSGKASPQFQDYIRAPEKYRGPKKDKAHTPLSTLFALYHGPAEGWDWRHTLAVAQVAAGHHSEFHDLDSLDTMLSCDFCDILVRQLSALDHDALQRAVGRILPRFNSEGVLDAVDEASDFLKFDFGRQLDALLLTEAVDYRLLVQLVFSVLLEADKAFLAVPAADRDRYLAPRMADLASARVSEYVAGKPSALINDLRTDARSALFAGIEQATSRVVTMTLPTGTGKTLLAASWALKTRERLRHETDAPPLILIVLPFLTVIEQTAQEYEQLFPGASESGVIANYHSLSDRTFATDLEDQSQDFFLDTWRSDVVITTFDQFLFALLSPKAKHQMRFHHLVDSVIVLDEVQAFPCVLWEPLRQALAGLIRLGSTHILAMSATQPGFLPEAQELIEGPEHFFGRLNRYCLVLRHRQPLGLSAFIDECRGRMEREWVGKRVMLTLNTRRSARRVRAALARDAERLGFRVEFITADVTPADRLEAVKRIMGYGHDGTPCLVVSTQCVEAGVDIDLEFVVRDFGPLDSIIQIAGRCNRNGGIGRGTVEVVRLVDDDGERKTEFAKQVYDPVLLDATHFALGRDDFINEGHVYPLTRTYFDELSKRKDTGEEALKRWAYWQEMPQSVRTMLRGPDRPQVTFVVIDWDTMLRSALESASEIKDRWAKRQALRHLAGRIARLSVSIYVRDHFDPADFADPFPLQARREDVWFWLLRPGHYTSEEGIDFGEKIGDDVWGTII